MALYCQKKKEDFCVYTVQHIPTIISCIITYTRKNEPRPLMHTGMIAALRCMVRKQVPLSPVSFLVLSLRPLILLLHDLESSLCVAWPVTNIAFPKVRLVQPTPTTASITPFFQQHCLHSELSLEHVHAQPLITYRTGKWLVCFASGKKAWCGFI